VNPKTPTVRTRHRDGVLVDAVRQSPIERLRRRFWRRVWLVFAILLLIWALAAISNRLTADVPEVFRSSEDHFKFGSIGSEPGGSVFHPVGGVLPPASIFAVLPDMFPDKLPGGYQSIGVLWDEPAERFVGISRRRRLGFDMAGLNCAICHTGTVRTAAGGPRIMIPGMPAHQLDLQRLFAFQFDAVLDPRFTPDNVVAHVEQRFGALSASDRFAMKSFVVPELRERFLGVKSSVGILFSDSVTPWGPGRVDTFNPYKALQFNWPLDRLPRSELSAASDFPALWNQRPRAQMQLHWDGNNDSLAERNLSAGLGAGITPVTADFAAIERVANYALDLPPPHWPAEFPPINVQLANAGEGIFRKRCAACHAFNGEKIGAVEPWEDRNGTDRARLDSYTAEFADNQNTLFPDSPRRFTHFRKTNGYTNQPLDGLWARAPYLHNGSVPNLRELLTSPEKRTRRFFRGNDVYDATNVGFESQTPASASRAHFLYDTTLPGNSNRGHRYGTDLTDSEKDQLIEYLKTL
jgi:mono/diheme cytochrome c family protein